MRQKLTQFGITLRKKRVERCETLGDMARDLGVSASFLSGIETGRKRAPNELVDKIVANLQLDMFEADALRKAAQETGPEIRIPLAGKGNDARSVAAAFARRFSNGDIEGLRGALERMDQGGIDRGKGD